MSDTRPVSVVTGPTGGIGRWIALGLVRAGHHVVLVARDRGRGEAAAAWIAQQAPQASTELRLADLRLLRPTLAVGQAIAAAHPRIAVLVNNAGRFTARREVTEEGHESVLAVNHLAPIVLADALERSLRAAAPSRIVNVGSSSSDRAWIAPDNLELVRGWSRWRAYSQSKLALLMATFTRAERLRGSGVVANAVHPGVVATGLIKEGGAIGLAWAIIGRFALSEEQGADPPLHVALAPHFATTTGAYVKRHAAVRPNRLALDRGLVERVERATESLIAATLPGGRERTPAPPGPTAA